MISEPAQSTIATFSAGLSAGVIAVLGVTYLSLLWGLFGALVGLMIVGPQGKGNAILSVIVGMLTGAVLAEGITTAISPAFTPRGIQSVEVALAFVIGCGSKQIMSAVIFKLIERIKSYGGQK